MPALPFRSAFHVLLFSKHLALPYLYSALISVQLTSSVAVGPWQLM
jgi:hypothetical protein